MNFKKLSLLICLWLLNSFDSFSQMNYKELETEIKISGNYFYEQAIAASEVVAEKKAIELLKANKEFQDYLIKSNKSIETIEIKFISWLIETSIKVIAYYPKNESQALNDLPIQTHSHKEDIKKDVNETFSSSKENEKSTTSSSLNLSRSFSVLSFVDFTYCEEIWNHLQTLNNQGVLVFSKRKDAFDDVKECYIVVCSNSKIVSILGKENLSLRYDYLASRQLKSTEYLSDNTNLYIYVYVF